MTKRSRIVLTAMALAALVTCLWLLGDLFEPVIPEPELVAPLPDVVNDAELTQPELELPVDAIDVTAEPPVEELAPAAIESSAEAKLIALAPDHRGRYGYEVLFQVVGRFGRPIANAQVALAPEEHPMNILGTTGGDGSLRVRWQAHVAAMRVAVSVAGPEKSWTGMRTEELAAGDSRQIQMALPGEQFSVGLEKKAKWIRWGGRGSDRAHAAPAGFYLSPRASSGGGVARFSWRSAMDEREASQLLRRLEWDRSAIERMSFISESPDTFKHVHVGDDEDQRYSARGVVYDSYGDPAKGALVTVGKTVEIPIRAAICDEKGRFKFESLEPGTWVVWAGGGSGGASLGTRYVEQRDVKWGKIVLERGFDMTGELFSAENLPLQDWLIEVEGRDRSVPFNAVARTEKDGSFSICNLPEGRLRLHVRPSASGWAIPTKTIEVAPNENYVSIQLGAGPAEILEFESSLFGPEPGAFLSVEISNASSSIERMTEICVIDEASGRGAWFGRRSSRSGASGRLMPGSYVCSAVSESRGASKVRRVLVDLESEYEEVKLKLPKGGSVSFEESTPRKGERIYTVWKRGLEVDSILSISKNRVPDRMDLPAGEYELEITAEELPPSALPFWVSDRNETEVTIPATD